MCQLLSGGPDAGRRSTRSHRAVQLVAATTAVGVRIRVGLCHRVLGHTDHRVCSDDGARQQLHVASILDVHRARIDHVIQHRGGEHEYIDRGVQRHVDKHGGQRLYSRVSQRLQRIGDSLLSVHASQQPQQYCDRALRIDLTVLSDEFYVRSVYGPGYWIYGLVRDINVRGVRYRTTTGGSSKRRFRLGVLQPVQQYSGSGSVHQLCSEHAEFLVEFMVPGERDAGLPQPRRQHAEPERPSTCPSFDQPVLYDSFLYAQCNVGRIRNSRQPRTELVSTHVRVRRCTTDHERMAERNVTVLDGHGRVGSKL